MAGNLNAIFNLEGTRVYTLVTYRGVCSISGKSLEYPPIPVNSSTESSNPETLSWPAEVIANQYHPSSATSSLAVFKKSIFR